MWCYWLTAGDKVVRKKRWKGGRTSGFRWLDDLNDVRRCSATDCVQYECGDYPSKQEKCTRSNFWNFEQKNQTRENRKTQQSESAVEPDDVESRLNKKVLWTESADVDQEPCTASKKQKHRSVPANNTVAIYWSSYRWPAVKFYPGHISAV